MPSHMGCFGRITEHERALEDAAVALEAARAKFHGSAAAVAISMEGPEQLNLPGLLSSLQAGNLAAYEAKARINKWLAACRKERGE